MKIKNSMKIILPSLSQNEAVARSCISSFLAQLDPTVEELADIRSAVSEAVTNSIVHGYREKNGAVEIFARVDFEQNLYIKIKDSGCGIEDVEKAMTPLFTTARNEERAGLGFAVMEAFMDSLSVKSIVGRGTTVVMKKKLSCNAENC